MNAEEAERFLAAAKVVAAINLNGQIRDLVPAGFDFLDSDFDEEESRPVPPELFAARWVKSVPDSDLNTRIELAEERGQMRRLADEVHGIQLEDAVSEKLHNVKEPVESLEESVARNNALYERMRDFNQLIADTKDTYVQEFFDRQRAIDLENSTREGLGLAHGTSGSPEQTSLEAKVRRKLGLPG